MSLDQAITTFVAFFVIIDPIGLVPIFVALTQGMSTAPSGAGPASSRCPSASG
jgi:small neutral amino acid transporter SnatA (MarC family)